ncbi:MULTISPECIES: hypothetical protein [Gilliamella]|jgi:hypothetical protein|uniref:Uncharacterized protein n=1 Tax=Gilliamella apis TaxID=1970738 RepID=A0A242NTE3_9GAMM|nr:MULTISPECIES: hypothetical protein [Gilliamella]OTQ48943.1 hypothetical protein B6D06_08450 [Gilliamella apis]
MKHTKLYTIVATAFGGLLTFSPVTAVYSDLPSYEKDVCNMSSDWTNVGSYLYKGIASEHQKEKTK